MPSGQLAEAGVSAHALFDTSALLASQAAPSSASAATADDESRPNLEAPTASDASKRAALAQSSVPPLAPRLLAKGPPPPSAFALIDEALARMEYGNAVFKLPETVDVDSSCPRRIDFVLHAHQGFSQLRAIIKESNASATNFHGDRVQMTNRMTARLGAQGDDFSIDPSGDQGQVASDKAPTT